MIYRIWHGWTKPERADAYQELLGAAIVPGILSQNIPGLRSIDILRRRGNDDDDVEFVTIMIFDDWAGVEAFAGPEPAASVVPPAARALLARHDVHSQHFELVASHTPDK